MPSLIASIGGNITGLTKSFEDAKRHAHKAGLDIKKELRSATPEDWLNRTGPMSKVGMFGMGDAHAKSAHATNEAHATGAAGFLQHHLAAIATIATVEHLTEQTVEYARKVEDTSLRLGISTAAVQEWDYALKQTGGSIEGASTFFERLAVNRAKAMAGDEKAIAAFNKLGVSMDELKSKRTEDIARTIGDTFEHGDPQDLIASLRSIGGKGAGEMVAAFRSGIGEMLDEYRATVGAMDEATVTQLASIGKSWERWGIRMRNDVFAPLLSWLATGFDKFMVGLDAVMAYAYGGFVGLGTGKGFMGGIHEWQENSKELREIAEKAEHAKEERLKKGLGKTSDEEDPEGKLELKDQKHLDAIEKQTAAQQRLAAIASMSATERLAFIREEIALIEQKLILDGLSRSEGGKGGNRGQKDTLELSRLSVELAREEAKESKQSIDDADKLLKSKRKGVFDKLDPQEQREMLAKEIRALNELAGTEADPHEKSALLLESQNKLNELDNIKGGAIKYSVNSLQQVGGFLGSYVQAPEVAALDVQRKSEGHLSAIRKDIARIAYASDSTAMDDMQTVEF